jgi:hypothetical protein
LSFFRCYLATSSTFIDRLRALIGRFTLPGRFILHRVERYHLRRRWWAREAHPLDLAGKVVGREVRVGAGREHGCGVPEHALKCHQIAAASDGEDPPIEVRIGPACACSLAAPDSPVEQRRE